MKLSRIIKSHSLNCAYRNKNKNPWSGLIEGDGYFGNYAANRSAKTGRHHYWYMVTCNDPRCKGRKIVHSSVLADA